MSSQAHAERLARALETTGLVQRVSANYSDGQIRLLLRVLQGKDAWWIQMVHRMLLAAKYEEKQAHAWQCHICRVYFLKDIDGELKLVFGWNVSIHSQEMSTSLDYLIGVIKGEEPGTRSGLKGETQEIEMLGVSGMRNMPNPRGKGAYTVGGLQGNNFQPQFRPGGATNK